MATTIYCWEENGCARSDCPTYGQREAVCWLEPLSQCHPPGQDFSLRLQRCLECAVLERNMSFPLMKRTLKYTTSRVDAAEKQMHDITFDFAVSFSEIYDMLSRLKSGDPGARVKVSSQHELLRKMEELLNMVAESVDELVSDSHEMAIGLCEHYDTLNKIADGCFEARATENSRNELIAKLGALINREALTLVGTIDSLKNADEQLKAAYQQLQDIIDFLPDGTFVIDQEGTIIAWNQAIEEITGATKKEMVGAGDHAYSIPFYGNARPILIDFINFDIDRLPPHNYSYINRKGASLDAEVHIPVFRGGSERFWATASPLFDRNGNQTGAIESIRDITHYKMAENEKLRLEAQLQQSQKMEAVGRLAGGIAHDFNNLLTAIIGYTSLLSLTVDDNPKLIHYVEQIDLVVRKAAKLTKDILTFSRKQIINPRPLDLINLIRGMEDMLRRLIGEDVQFRIDYSDEPLTVHVDSGQFQQVILNLITNARDAMPRGGTLNIVTGIACDSLLGSAVDTEPDPTRYALITVADTGIGMDEKTKERIFEPFYTTKDVGKGTGLGLSIAFGIISQHNGFIRVESSPRAGTKFHIYLPIHESADAVQPDAAYQPSEQISRGSETVLLAEDNLEAREVMTATLEKAGYTVITAVDGEDATHRFRESMGRISLVILDVIMPKKNGKETFDEIRRMDGAVKAIFTSGYTADIIQRRGQFAMGVNFISKPTAPAELLEKVREVLDGPGTRKSRAA